ncbi:MAG: DUF1127 domain-containing protein [Rhodospirillales bacterium]|nr:DUF1127 domain-containing protein [Rhodospirillales bacterium]
MSTFSNSLTSREALAGTTFRRIGTILKTWWFAYINWRLEQLAISRLRSMSDRELKDIGVSRAQIEFAVKGGAYRHPMFTRYY